MSPTTKSHLILYSRFQSTYYYTQVVVLRICILQVGVSIPHSNLYIPYWVVCWCCCWWKCYVVACCVSTNKSLTEMIITRSIWKAFPIDISIIHRDKLIYVPFLRTAFSFYIPISLLIPFQLFRIYRTISNGSILLASRILM